MQKITYRIYKSFSPLFQRVVFKDLQRLLESNAWLSTFLWRMFDLQRWKFFLSKHVQKLLNSFC